MFTHTHITQIVARCSSWSRTLRTRAVGLLLFALAIMQEVVGYPLLWSLLLILFSHLRLKLQLVLSLSTERGAVLNPVVSHTHMCTYI